MTDKLQNGTPEQIRSLTIAAFKVIEAGPGQFIARGNFACCSTCARYELAELAEEMGRSRIAYWHEQDDDYLAEGYPLHIRFCYLYDGDDEAKMKIETGKRIAAVLRTKGLCVRWDGDPNKTILVIGLK